MCGILGIVSGDIDDGQFKSALKSIAHRGPDSHGIYSDKGVSLGHQRLSIIDLSKKASQPMRNEKGDKWIVYNGELYNFKQLREDLEKKGYSFSSCSDTEVILSGYEEWGEDCVKRFNGMFAFAIWDSKKRSLFIARDRTGIKPLYYYFNNGHLVFASEIKSILELSTVKREINKAALNQYLSFRFNSGEETFFKNIFRLMPGHFMKTGDISLKACADDS